MHANKALLSYAVVANECILGLHNCNNETQNCIDEEISYKCVCKKGFKLKDGKCVDEDECDPTQPEYKGECSGSGGTCENTKGGFTCICPVSKTSDSKR